MTFRPMTFADTLSAAEQGDELAQLRAITRSLAVQLGLIALTLPKSPSRDATISLSSAALEFLDGPHETPTA